MFSFVCTGLRSPLLNSMGDEKWEDQDAVEEGLGVRRPVQAS